MVATRISNLIAIAYLGFFMQIFMPSLISTTNYVPNSLETMRCLLNMASMSKELVLVEIIIHEALLLNLLYGIHVPMEKLLLFSFIPAMLLTKPQIIYNGGMLTPL